MTIKKGDFGGKLKKPLFELLDVTLQYPTHSVRLMLVSRRAIDDAINKSDKCGVPMLAALEGNSILCVYPPCDKRYRFRVVGTQVVEQ